MSGASRGIMASTVARFAEFVGEDPRARSDQATGDPLRTCRDDRFEAVARALPRPVGATTLALQGRQGNRPLGESALRCQRSARSPDLSVEAAVVARAWMYRVNTPARTSPATLIASCTAAP